MQAVHAADADRMHNDRDLRPLLIDAAADEVSSSSLESASGIIDALDPEARRILGFDVKAALVAEKAARAEVDANEDPEVLVETRGVVGRALALGPLTKVSGNHGPIFPLPGGTKNVPFSVMEKHIDRVASLFDTLDKLKFSVSAELQPLYLLRTLPRDDCGPFDNLRASITSVPATGLTLDVVENKLLAHADPDAEDSDGPDSGTETAANTAQAAGRSTSSARYCHYHKSTTHNTEDCKVLKAAEQQGKGKKAKKGKDAKVTNREQANSAQDNDSDSTESAHVATVSSGIYKRIYAYVARETTSTRDSVLIDSGASCTMTHDTSFFETNSLRPLNPPRRVRLGDNSTCHATAKGTMRLSCKTTRGPVDLAIHDALLVPDFTVTLLSVPQLASKQLSSHFVGDKCVVRDDRTRKTVLEASRQRGLYHISCQPLGMDVKAHFAMDINSVHHMDGLEGASRGNTSPIATLYSTVVTGGPAPGERGLSASVSDAGRPSSEFTPLRGGADFGTPGTAGPEDRDWISVTRGNARTHRARSS
ncbi:hypothetical protein B0H14DRAFT_3484671 [Mycena olivaceomarginata]|nr:hypothetical protein B0H14DRAFT_3484671 [Mycena olivaceomarginata]